MHMTGLQTYVLGVKKNKKYFQNDLICPLYVCKQYASTYVESMFLFQLGAPFHFNVGGGICGRTTCSSIGCIHHIYYYDCL